MSRIVELAWVAIPYFVDRSCHGESSAMFPIHAEGFFVGCSREIPLSLEHFE